MSSELIEKLLNEKDCALDVFGDFIDGYVERINTIFEEEWEQREQELRYKMIELEDEIQELTDKLNEMYSSVSGDGDEDHSSDFF